MTRKTAKILVADHAASVLRTLHPYIKKKIKAAVQAIAETPHSGKVLVAELAGLRSFRVSRFRIIYRLKEEKQIEIIAIGPRDRIYEETYRLVCKKEKP